MYRREKPLREENYKPRRAHKHTPSFSSSLLDEIYRSIDGNTEKSEDAFREKPLLKQSGFRGKSRYKSSVGDEEMGKFTRACLVEKWMEKEVNQKAVSRQRPSLVPEFFENDKNPFQDNDQLVFFSSTSSSSDSSGALSSSDNEFFGSKTKSKVACFLVPKPIRTRGHNRQEECFLIDDYQTHQKNKTGDDFMKCKSRALKTYANLKKVKQPISPGARLTSFINSLFTNPNGKNKSKKVDEDKGLQDLKFPKAASSSTCSSASSYSRSCLTKYSSTDKMRDGIQRTVRFHPVGVIVDQDSKPCGQKSICDEDFDRYRRPPLPPKASQKVLNEFSIFRKIQNEDNDEDDDGASDSSSDLFELDHLALFGNNRFCEDLPVYETTYFDENRVIGSGLIR